MTEDYRQITIEGMRIGVVGLNAIMREARAYRDETDEVIGARLLEAVKKKNYMHPKSERAYREALLREFKRSIGEKVEEEKPAFLDIKILGPGCHSCDKLMKETLGVLGKTGIVANVEHVIDPSQIARFGMVATPALAVDGEVLSAGKVLSTEQIVKLLK